MIFSKNMPQSDTKSQGENPNCLQDMGGTKNAICTVKEFSPNLVSLSVKHVTTESNVR